LEHSLQILCVALIAQGLTGDRSRCSPHWSFWVALFMLPLVRYEGLAVSLPVLAYSFSLGHRRNALLIAAALTLAIALFSVYLHAKGLGLLPSSVLAKSSGFGLKAGLKNLQSNLEGQGWLALLMLGCGAYFWKSDRARGVMVLAICALHFCFGRHGSYGRYEVYFSLFLVLMAFDAFCRQYPSSWKFVYALPVAFPGLIYATLMSPLASSNIYHQQAQMASMR
jgi:hypothetical protein